MRKLLETAKWLVVLSLACIFLDVPPAPGSGCREQKETYRPALPPEEPAPAPSNAPAKSS